jgi:hypothetical protein
MPVRDVQSCVQLKIYFSAISTSAAKRAKNQHFSNTEIKTTGWK